MEINRVDPSFPIRPARTVDFTQADAASETPRDLVSISPQARLREQLRAAPDIRTDRVADLRRRIQTGTYDEAGALGEAARKLLDELR